MLRQILTVAVGIVLSFLLASVAGYLYYSYLSHVFSEEVSLGRFARHIANPAIALLVGACVGAMAKSPPEVLAALSLIPSALVTFLYRRQDASHMLLLIFLELVCLFIGAGAARVAFRIRGRSSST
jgi:hypothetical protein